MRAYLNRLVKTAPNPAIPHLALTPNPNRLVKTILNPFCAPNSKITSPEFDARVRAAAKRHL